MKISQTIAAVILLALSVSLNAFAQTGSAAMQRFSSGGVAFQYPPAWTLSDKSTQDNHHLVLELKGTAAQIMILVERTPSTQPGQRAAVLRARSSTFADLMTKELEKVGATVQRSEVTTEAGGVLADGLRLRAAPGGAPGSVEVYSLVLGGRLVMITLLRPDSDAQAAAPAWAAVRTSLRVGANSGSARATYPVNAFMYTTARPSIFASLDQGKPYGLVLSVNDLLEAGRGAE